MVWGCCYVSFHLAVSNASALPRHSIRVQRLDSPSVALLVSMVVALGYGHRLTAGEVVVDLLDRDADSAPSSAGTCSFSKRSMRASSSPGPVAFKRMVGCLAPAGRPESPRISCEGAPISFCSVP